MSDQIISYIRTYVPVAIGSLLSFVVTRYGIVVDEEISTALATLLTAVLIAVYYFLARQAEKRWPQVGKLLLGSAKQPEYKVVK